MAADGIAVAAKTRGRSRHGCLCGCGSRQWRRSGAAETAAGRSRGKSSRGKDLSRPRDSEPFEKGPSVRKRLRAPRGNTPREGLFPFLFPPPQGRQAGQPWRRQGRALGKDSGDQWLVTVNRCARLLASSAVQSATPNEDRALLRPQRRTASASCVPHREYPDLILLRHVIDVIASPAQKNATGASHRRAPIRPTDV